MDVVVSESPLPMSSDSLHHSYIYKAEHIAYSNSHFLNKFLYPPFPFQLLARAVRLVFVH